jgi:uncharacterized protein YndB with AHSA1/START domain
MMTATQTSALTLELSRRFEALAEQVFDAWLGNEWGEWLPPAGARCEVVRMEPRVGGNYLLRMTMGDGRTVEIAGRYREIERPRKLVLSWTGNYNNQETVITLTFRADGAGTVMTLRQESFPDAQLRDGYQAGWTGAGGSFDKLAQLLARKAA